MKRLFWLAGAVVLAAGVLAETAFIVPEGLQAARAAKNPTWLEPGLHFRSPFGSRLIWRDQRRQFLIADGTEAQPYVQVTTFDQKNLELGYVLLWQGKELAGKAERLSAEGIIRTAVNQALSQCCLSQTLAQWLHSASLANIVEQALNRANTALAEQGLRVTQLAITSIAVPEADREGWLNDMKLHGQDALNRLQLQTSTLAANLKAEVDNKVTQTLVEGKKQAELIRAKADAEATEVYADAYRKNPDFYEFYMSLKANQQVFKARPPVLVLSTNSPFVKALNGG